MRCPYCNFPEDKVVDSRSSGNGLVIRRRRECLKCKCRFTTYERQEKIPLMVIKKDGRRESFDREKILNGIVRACEKRPISIERIGELVDEIERVLQSQLEKEVSSQEVGELAMRKLHDLDEVAYVRFASVYRQFRDITDFMKEVKRLLG
ncbi:transcriptional regulator NrdR [candidate division NPL-UPA2 bacterium]|nr:transcriptional regulator NrdR [candidate division NPL-UPA2 bacterium]